MPGRCSKIPIDSFISNLWLHNKWKMDFEETKMCKIHFQKKTWHFFLSLEFKWVTFIISKFCPVLFTALSCPEGKDYQPCVPTCEARTCLNRWFYGHSSCMNLREDCVCNNGTILHRPDSTQCIPEKECGEQRSTKWLLRDAANNAFLGLGEMCWERLIKAHPGVGKETSLLVVWI